MNITNKQLAEFFGKNRHTIAKWKKENSNIYNALKEYYERNFKDKE